VGSMIRVGGGWWSVVGGEAGAGEPANLPNLRTHPNIRTSEHPNLGPATCSGGLGGRCGIPVVFRVFREGRHCAVSRAQPRAANLRTASRGAAGGGRRGIRFVFSCFFVVGRTTRFRVFWPRGRRVVGHGLPEGKRKGCGVEVSGGVAPPHPWWPSLRAPIYGTA
jgi:hypothetical protein